MTDKPSTADGFRGENLTLVRAACLYVATKLGDFINDIVIVGGLAPSLLIDQEHLAEGIEAHAGTMDLDVGLALAILDEERYRTLTQRLREAGFTPDVSEAGNATHQRWKIEAQRRITLDFLIPPSNESDRGGSLHHIEQDFAAVVTPGLHLAFQDRRSIRLAGMTITGEQATRYIWVCGPGAFVVLKALAFNGRGTNKDAYDLSYVLGGVGVEETAESLKPFLDDGNVQEALEIIRRDFTEHEGVGPMRVAAFLRNGPDDEVQADVVGLVLGFLAQCERNDV